MGMFNFVLDSIKGEIFDFKVKRRVYFASTVCENFFVDEIGNAKENTMHLHVTKGRVQQMCVVQKLILNFIAFLS